MGIFDSREIYERFVNKSNELKLTHLQFEKRNAQISVQIGYLHKKMSLIDITHSNTTNFILFNYNSLQKFVLQKLYELEDNLKKINYIKKQIKEVNYMIYVFELKFSKQNVF